MGFGRKRFEFVERMLGVKKGGKPYSQYSARLRRSRGQSDAHAVETMKTTINIEVELASSMFIDTLLARRRE